MTFIPVQFKWKLKKAPQGVTVREWRKALKNAWTIVGRYWHDVLREKHFSPQAHWTYGYANRTMKYRLRKQAMANSSKTHNGVPVVGGMNDDNVYTGRTRESMEHVDIQAFPTRAKLKYRLPRYAIIRHYQSRRPWIMAEVMRVNATDRRELNYLFVQSLAKELHKETKEVIKIIGGRNRAA